MKKVARFFSFENKTWMIIISAIAALFICFVADPLVEATYTVDLQYINQEALGLKELALSDSTNYTNTITVTVVGRKSRLSNLTASEIISKADFSKISNDGAIILDTPTLGNTAGAYVLSYSPAVVYRNVVYTGETPSKTFNIVAHFQSNIIDEYELIHYSLTTGTISTKSVSDALESKGGLTEDQINVLINSINKVEANILVEDRIEPYTDSVALTFLDKDGNVIESLSSLCYIDVDVIIGKRLSVELQFAGQLEEGYYIISSAPSPLSVSVYSLTNPGFLATLDSVVLTEVVHLDGKNGSFTANVGLMLPDEVSVFGNDSKTVNAIVQIGKYDSKSINMSTEGIEISVSDIDAGFKFSVDQNINVKLYGKSEDLAKVNVDNLKIVVDGNNLNVGQYVCNFTIDGLPEGVYLSSSSTITVNVGR